MLNYSKLFNADKRIISKKHIANVFPNPAYSEQDDLDSQMQTDPAPLQKYCLRRHINFEYGYNLSKYLPWEQCFLNCMEKAILFKIVNVRTTKSNSIPCHIYEEKLGNLRKPEVGEKRLKPEILVCWNIVPPLKAYRNRVNLSKIQGRDLIRV